MKVGILGTGVYGIALARVLFKNNNSITMWTKFEDEKDFLKNNRYCKNMPDIILDKDINITCDLENTVKNSDLIIIVIPSDFVYGLLEEISNYIDNKIVCIASKGIDPSKSMFISDIAKSFNIENIVFISGPTFAHEMANYDACGLTIASEDNKISKIIYNLFKNDNLKLEISTDIIGIQLSSTLKNIFAIVMGMLDEANYSASTKSLIITSLINELNNVIDKNSNIITSLSGIGDIWLTCTNNQSRNYTFGKLLVSKKEDINEYLKNNTVEGYDNLKIILKLKEIYHFKFPLIECIYKIVNEENSIDDLIKLIINE